MSSVPTAKSREKLSSQRNLSKTITAFPSPQKLESTHSFSIPVQVPLYQSTLPVVSEKVEKPLVSKIAQLRSSSNLARGVPTGQKPIQKLKKVSEDVLALEHIPVEFLSGLDGQQDEVKNTNDMRRLVGEFKKIKKGSLQLFNP